MKPAPSRRHLLAVAPAALLLPSGAVGGAASALGPPVAPSEADPDAALLALAQRWRAVYRAIDVVCHKLAVAEAAGDAPGQATAWDRSRRLVDIRDGLESRIADLPAHGAAGMAVKAALLARVFLGPSEPVERHRMLARTLAADARRLVPCAAGVEA